MLFRSKYILSKRKYEKKIVKAMKEAEEGNKIKSHFIANISHEVRTPVNVILSAIKLLEINKTLVHVTMIFIYYIRTK